MELLTDILAVYGDNDGRRRDLLTQLTRDAIQRLDRRSVEVLLGAIHHWEAADPSGLDLLQTLIEPDNQRTKVGGVDSAPED